MTAMGLMHDDGYGPARLLFHPYFKQFFPQGYLLAVPDRSTAMVFSKTMSRTDRQAAETMIKEYYTSSNGVCDRFLEPDELPIPNAWLDEMDQWVAAMH